MGQHIKTDFHMLFAFPTPSDAIFVAYRYRTLAKIVQDWKINYSNDASEKAARLLLLDSLGMSQGFDVPVNRGAPLSLSSTEPP